MDAKQGPVGKGNEEEPIQIGLISFILGNTEWKHWRSEKWDSSWGLSHRGNIFRASDIPIYGGE